MKKLGLFLAKNTTNILALYFLGWAVWAGMNLEAISLVQKLVMGLFFLLVLHEYEEAYKERFWAVMGKVLGVTRMERGKQEQLRNPWKGRDAQGNVRPGSGTAGLNSAQFTPHGISEVFKEGWKRENVK